MQTIISWVLAAFCLFLGVFDFIDKDYIRGIIMVLGCILALPMTSNLFSKDGNSKGFFVFKVIVIIVMILGTSIKITR